MENKIINCKLCQSYNIKDNLVCFHCRDNNYECFYPKIRYLLKNGKFGYYFYDNILEKPIGLKEVFDILNDI